MRFIFTFIYMYLAKNVIRSDWVHYQLTIANLVTEELQIEVITFYERYRINDLLLFIFFAQTRLHHPHYFFHNQLRFKFEKNIYITEGNLWFLFCNKSFLWHVRFTRYYEMKVNSVGSVFAFLHENYLFPCPFRVFWYLFSNQRISLCQWL